MRANEREREREKQTEFGLKNNKKVSEEKGRRLKASSTQREGEIEAKQKYSTLTTTAVTSASILQRRHKYEY